ncbi:MAG: DNA topoisomerase (ATP-hydrolyzing) subunit B [Candidatus Moranbacteria bacterium CG_4_8_14_3_um_filter_41_13]|nr:MAG: DNA gyrase subunit B [Candidatus Moranbacteria bacterium CG2_30_41_165]PIW94016.1 MAG: DNA topoisomerase (ATP-hydrolyzing) subunit B [Candidatus Moranbacteria bacterium CG_4_8_14_3_um_filter_41_13]
MAKKEQTSYGAKSIQVLEGLDPVRKRPGMYIGGTSLEGLHHLIWEVVNNSIDEAMAGHCTSILIRLLPDNWVEVTDDGRGIPVEIHPQTKKSTLETVMTVLHAGGKFGGEGGYKISGGLHGVGVSVVNALSIVTRVTVMREGKVWVQEYHRGKPVADVKAIGKSKTTGTTVAFQADPEIFPEISYSWNKILEYLRYQAFLTKGIRIHAEDCREVMNEKETYKAERQSFYFDSGIVSFVKFLNRKKAVKNVTPVYIEKTVNDIYTEVSFQFTDGFKEHMYSFANNILNPGGGTHVTGFKMALTRTMNDYAKKNNLLKEKEGSFTSEDLSEGLTAVISVKLANPQFEGQTKDKLNNNEVRGAVSQVTSEGLAEFLETHPNDARAMIDKCLLTVRARIAARAAKDAVLRKGALEGMTLPGKLADCTTRDAERSEVYIVEGDSAGGSAKQGRNREFQAILPLRGKLVNVEKTSLDKVVKSDTLKPIIIALGAGIGETFDLSKLRYGKVIIMADADVDGAHIRTLLLTFFYRYYESLIREGHVFIAQPPLYRVQKGKDTRYAYTEEDKLRIIEEMKKLASEKASTKKGKKSKKEESEEEASAEDAVVLVENEGEGASAHGITLQRYKGLGEMNPEQLWETTMDPDNRIMLKVNIEDAEAADELFDILMGNEVEPRRRFIQTHAKTVKNLDI